MHRRSWSWAVGAAAVLVGALVPYLVAARAQPPDLVFSGFLVNPVDGFSYLAKMRQGAGGSWMFRLPYAADPGEGSLLFVYYLLLGHIQRLSRASPLVVYHAARLAGGFLMVLAARQFFEIFVEDTAARRRAFALVLFGSGLGWVAMGVGRLSIDLWVPEAIPFLSILVSAHFSLAAAAMLTASVAIAGPVRPRGGRVPWAAASGLVLALVQPFAVFVVLAVAAVWLVWERTASATPALPERSPRLMAWLAFGLVSLPWIVYDLWVTRVNPALAAWSSQNLTPSPPVLDVVLGFGLVLPLAAIGVIRSRKVASPSGRFLVVWLVIGLGMVFAPVPLQRRLLLGVFFPMAALAGVSLATIRKPRLASAALLALCLPTNAIVVAATLGGALRGEPDVVLTTAESRAYAWIDREVPDGSLVLAEPVSGNRLPAFADIRVVYGHPFETPGAEAEEAWVTSFFAGGLDAGEALARLRARDVDYVFVGPRETAMGAHGWAAALRVVYDEGGVAVYEVPPS